MRPRSLIFTMIASLLSVCAFSQSRAQNRKPIETRRPAIHAPASPAGAPAPNGDFRSNFITTRKLAPTDRWIFIRL